MSKDKNKREQKQEANEAQRPTLAGADLSKETEAVDDDRLIVTEQFPVKGRETITGVAQPEINDVSKAMGMVAPHLLRAAVPTLGDRMDQLREEKAKEHRDSCVKALKALVGAKLGDRLEGPLREVISDLTEGTVNAAIKNRLEIIAAVCHDDAVRKALEALA